MTPPPSLLLNRSEPEKSFHRSIAWPFDGAWRFGLQKSPYSLCSSTPSPKETGFKYLIWPVETLIHQIEISPHPLSSPRSHLRCVPPRQIPASPSSRPTTGDAWRRLRFTPMAGVHEPRIGLGAPPSLTTIGVHEPLYFPFLCSSEPAGPPG
jgi:hypothetical protein